MFALKSKKARKQIGPFVFWENLWRANLLLKLTDFNNIHCATEGQNLILKNGEFEISHFSSLCTLRGGKRHHYLLFLCFSTREQWKNALNIRAEYESYEVQGVPS